MTPFRSFVGWLIEMTVRVKVHGRFRAAANSDELSIDRPVKNVDELLRELIRELGPRVSAYIFDSSGKLGQSLVVFINGQSIRMAEGLNTPLSKGDNVTIDSIDMLEIAGGG